MDIIVSIGSFLVGDVGAGLLKWITGITISAWLFMKLKEWLSKAVSGITRRIKGHISSIEDDNLREAARCVVRYVASKIPKAEGQAKLDFAIRKLQDITPDILVSDDKVEILIQSAYNELKLELAEI